MSAPIKGLVQALRSVPPRADGTPVRYGLPTGMIGWVVDKYHVSTSAYTVARDWYARAKAHPMPIRRAVFRVAMRRHEANRRLYMDVTRGR